MTSIDAIINRQLLKWEHQKREAEDEKQKKPAPSPIITISRETGSRGSYFGSRLAMKLGYQRLHREVIDSICKSSGYRKRVIESLDDRFRGDLSMMVESFFTGQSVDHSDYHRYLYQVVLSLSQLGGIVLMGRGGNFILGPERGFHIRFICDRDCRVENLMKYKNIGEEEANEAIDESDNKRREFAWKLFHAEINTPHYYDLVLNSTLIDVEELVDTAVTAFKGKMDKLLHREND
ncbi:MAG: AAA family ATPase [Candidatus Zixiibacteriota bacterium]